MSKKKNIKYEHKYCFTCGKALKIKERHIHKINTNKKHSKFNSVVLCLECKYYLQKNRIQVFDLVIPKYCLEQYSCDKDFIKTLLRKIISLRS